MPNDVNVQYTTIGVLGILRYPIGFIFRLKTVCSAFPIIYNLPIASKACNSPRQY